MTKLSILFLLFFTLGAGNCSGVKMRADITPVSAAEANDKTVLIEGCGNQPVVGYTYCRVREGSPTEQPLTLIAPPIKCSTKPCVVFTVFYPNGEPSQSIAMPDGKTRLAVSWRDLTKRDTFQKNDRGFWPIVMTYRWIGTDGKEYTSTAEGELRLRVLAMAYVSLHESGSDSNLVWRWSEKAFKYGFSTAGRAYVGR